MRKLVYIALIFLLTVPALASADTVGPTTSILSPIANTVASKNTVNVLVQVWDNDGLNGTTPIEMQINSGSWFTAGITDSGRACVPASSNCKIYQYSWDISSYADSSSNTIAARTKDTLNQTTTKSVTITVKAAKTGDGYLLSRGRSSQICIDCHNVVSHSSQSTDTGYGNWAILCTDCHTPHNTTNIMLIKETITTPNSGDKPVALWNRSGDAVKSFVDSTATGANIKGVCQVCHTQTTGSGTSRWRNTGNGESPAHYGGGSTQRCSTCHSHLGGFKASCNSCHGNPPTTATTGGPTGLATPATGATSPLSPGAHEKHTAAPRSMLCNTCHTGNTMPTVSYTIQIGFVTNSTNYPGWGPTAVTTGSFNGYNNLNNVPPQYTFVSSNPPDTTVSTSASYANTCSSLYCHGSALTAGTLTSPSWVGGSSQAGCGTCHGGAGYAVSTATPPTTGKHITHAATTTGNLGLACNKCHNSTSNMAHVNGTVAWSLDTADSRFGASAIYNGAVSGTTPGLAPSATYGNCQNLYCHSNGKVGTSVGSYVTPAPAWGGVDIGCNGCHGTTTTAGTPDYANEGAGTVGANSHTKHTGAGTATCVYCHSTTTTTGTTITGTVHINNTRNVFEGGGTKTFSYTPQTCTNISCHGGFGTAATWGGAALTCASCHSGAGDVDDTVYDNGTTARIDSTQWDYSGHGRVSASGNYLATANAPADLPGAAGTGDPCLYCHDGSGVTHGDATNVFRLRNFSHATFGKNGNCLVCHGTGQAGVDPDGAGTVYANKTAAKKIDKYHYGSKHSSSLSGGQFCWDCHDPHGDSTDALVGPIAMVQRYPAQASNATTGAPTTITSSAVSFTARSVASDYGSSAATKICNVCHTYSAGDPTMVHYYNTTPFTDSHNSATICTQCHKHSSDTTYNNEAFKGGGCNGCHSYDTVAGSWGSQPQSIQGWGAHAKHIDHIKVRFTVTLAPTTDTFGAGNAAKVCGACHTNASVDHSTSGGAGTTRNINFGGSRFKEGSTDGTDGFSFLFGATNPAYSGVSGTSSSVNPKSCSVVGCHFTTSPVWQAY